MVNVSPALFLIAMILVGVYFGASRSLVTAILLGFAGFSLAVIVISRIEERPDVPADREP